MVKRKKKYLNILAHRITKNKQKNKTNTCYFGGIGHFTDTLTSF